MAEIRICHGKPDDCQSTLELLNAAFAQHRGKIQPESSVFRESVDSLRLRLDTQALLLAYVGNTAAKPVGCVFCKPQADSLYFGRLAVHPDFRGSGIAQTLIQQVEKEAMLLDYARVTLEVRIILKHNVAFFESAGYLIKSSHAHDGFEQPTFYTMAKDL